MAIERSKDFVNFLTICRKLGYRCIYILHSLKTKWLPIMEQTKIFVFFKTSTITPVMLNLIRDQSMQINKTANRTSRKNWLYQVYMDIVQRGYFKGIPR